MRIMMMMAHGMNEWKLYIKHCDYDEKLFKPVN